MRSNSSGVALLVAALEEEDPGHQALLRHQRRLPGRVGERRELLGDRVLGHAEAGEQRHQAAAALLRELLPLARVGGEVDGRRIPLQAGHDAGEEVGPGAAVRERVEPAHDLVIPELGVGQDGDPGSRGPARQPSPDGSKRPAAIRVPAVVPCSSSSASRAGSRPPITQVSKRALPSIAGRCSSTSSARPAAAQRGEVGDAQAPDRRSSRGRVGEQAVGLLDQHEPPGADLIGDPRGDRVGGHLPRGGQRVEGQAGGQQHRGTAGRRARAPVPGRRTARHAG